MFVRGATLLTSRPPLPPDTIARSDRRVARPSTRVFSVITSSAAAAADPKRSTVGVRRRERTRAGWREPADGTEPEPPRPGRDGGRRSVQDGRGRQRRSAFRAPRGSETLPSAVAAVLRHVVRRRRPRRRAVRPRDRANSRHARTP